MAAPRAGYVGNRSQGPLDIITQIKASQHHNATKEQEIQHNFAQANQHQTQPTQPMAAPSAGHVGNRSLGGPEMIAQIMAGQRQNGGREHELLPGFAPINEQMHQRQYQPTSLPHTTAPSAFSAATISSPQVLDTPTPATQRAGRDLASAIRIPTPPPPRMGQHKVSGAWADAEDLPDIEYRPRPLNALGSTHNTNNIHHAHHAHHSHNTHNTHYAHHSHNAHNAHHSHHPHNPPNLHNSNPHPKTKRGKRAGLKLKEREEKNSQAAARANGQTDSDMAEGGYSRDDRISDFDIVDA
ncbi:hypothetical protein EJ08DRAFT_702952 [Tothia fuscella]|uniref:Uncharacterized protein n=1 Tax=Tothia fuscella TaxID=1048955 RepID=A0A9P4NF89_9PEZI|nr:hypothetical protein EJ08DRAFT_702952 [Tothia fuscella]